jgi:class 3 adenylate cyclase
MMSARRLALSLVCAASFTTALATASPALAVQSPQISNPACGATAQDYSGTFTGLFDRANGDTIGVTFAAPESVATSWHVEGWDGSGSGTYQLADGGVTWNDSDSLTGPATGVDTENYRSTAVMCAADSNEVDKLAGVETSGGTQYPFTLTRQS